VRLENRIAVITGSGRGIGRSIALAFAREGAKLMLMARTGSQVEAVCAEAEAIGAEVVARAGDIAKKADVEKLVAETLARFGPPDILVNNAGVSKGRALLVDSDDDTWREVIDINLLGTYMMTKHFLRIMIPRKSGRIITIASIAGKSPQPFNSAYTASKHGIIGMMKTVAAEMGIAGAREITVNVICPGAVKTEMLEGEGGLFEFLSSRTGETKEEAARRVREMSVQARMLDPGEIAGLAVFLASHEGRGITGQAFTIDGGQIMY
jgi:NAD(P)-dependent dehydrogenase (short-subunit alcohol dehydrogenase family)